MESCTRVVLMDNIFDAMDIAARLNDGQTYANHPSHHFGGEDMRCMDCDCRMFGRHAPHPCPVWE